MRTLGALCLLVVAGCTSLQWETYQNDLSTTIGAPRDSVLRVAATQLQHHGFHVVPAGEELLVTTPRAVPQYATEVANDGAGEQLWFLRIQAVPVRLTGGTRLTVSGFLVPRGTRLAAASTAPQQAIPLTAEAYPRLFREVEQAAEWIGAALERKRAEG